MFIELDVTKTKSNPIQTRSTSLFTLHCKIREKIALTLKIPMPYGWDYDVLLYKPMKGIKKMLICMYYVSYQIIRQLQDW